MDGYNHSEMATYQPQTVKTITPTVAYNGRRVQLTGNEDGPAIYYTLDGTPAVDGLDVSGHATEYHGEFDIDELCQLRAVAKIDSLNVSDENVHSIDYLYDGQTDRRHTSDRETCWARRLNGAAAWTAWSG